MAVREFPPRGETSCYWQFLPVSSATSVLVQFDATIRNDSVLAPSVRGHGGISSTGVFPVSSYITMLQSLPICHVYFV